MVKVQFVFGALTGAAIVGGSWFASNLHKALDAGVSLTHAFQVQDTLRAESDVLRAMAEPSWLGLPEDVAKEQLETLGLYEFSKGGEGFAAGPVFLRVQDQVIVEIQTYCARSISDGCKDEGVN